MVDYSIFLIFIQLLLCQTWRTIFLIFIIGDIMSNMAEARRKMHERDERVKKENKSEVKKIRNFLFGCCNDKESKKVKEHK